MKLIPPIMAVGIELINAANFGEKDKIIAKYAANLTTLGSYTFDNANTPTLDYLRSVFPQTVLEASGQLVGLPSGQMGTSEVGHMNIGAGRIVYQSLEMINNAIETGEFYHNENILKVINHTKENNSKLHIMGLISDGGIHSHTSHLLAIIEMCKQNGIKEIYFH